MDVQRLCIPARNKGSSSAHAFNDCEVASSAFWRHAAFATTVRRGSDLGSLVPHAVEHLLQSTLRLRDWSKPRD